MERGIKIALVVLMIVSVMALGITGCAKEEAPAPAAPAPEVITLTGQTGLPAKHPLARGFQWWADELEKRTKGRVKVDVFYGTPLGKVKAHFDMIAAGTIDIGFFPWCYRTGVFPLLEMFYQPISWPSNVVASRVNHELYEKGWFDKELGDLRVAYFFTTGPNVIFTSKPIRSMEDLKGVMIRSAGLMGEVVTRLGGTPVSVASAEQYSALEKGVVDGTIQTYATVQSLKLHEIVKYATSTHRTCNGLSYLMNPGRFKSLPSDIQKIIDGLMEDAAIMGGRCYDKDDESGLKVFKEAGGEVITLAPDEAKRWDEALDAMVEDYLDELEAKGIPAREYLKDLIKLRDKYE